MFKLIAIACFAALVGAGASAHDLASSERTILTVSGAIANAGDDGVRRFDRAALAALGVEEVRTSTEWTDGVSVFRGPRLSTLLDAVGAEGDSVRAIALNDYAVEIPVEDARRFKVILAFEQDGRPLSVRMKGPIWVIYPWDDESVLRDPLYNARSIWQLNRLDIR